MKISRRLPVLCSAALACVVVSTMAAAQGTLAPTPVAPPIALRFDFSAGPQRPGFTRVAPTATYTNDAGYGYQPGAQLSTGDSGNTTTGDKPFLFSARVPEGNFNVTVTFGDSAIATTTTFKAESGRLMLERVDVPAGNIAERTFTTNVRIPNLPKLPLNATGREEVSLDQFDGGNTRDWDSKLTIEVVSLGHHAALRTIEITLRARRAHYLPRGRFHHD